MESNAKELSNKEKFYFSVIALRNYLRHFSGKEQLRKIQHNLDLHYSLRRNDKIINNNFTMSALFFQKLKLMSICQQNYVIDSYDEKVSENSILEFYSNASLMASYLYNFTKLREYFYITKDKSGPHSRALFEALLTKCGVLNHSDYRKLYLDLLEGLGLNDKNLNDFLEIRDKNYDIFPDNANDIDFEMSIYDYFAHFIHKKSNFEKQLEKIENLLQTPELKDIKNLKEEYEKIRNLKKNETRQEILLEIEKLEKLYEVYKNEIETKIDKRKINTSKTFKLDGNEICINDFKYLKYNELMSYVERITETKNANFLVIACGLRELDRQNFIISRPVSVLLGDLQNSIKEMTTCSSKKIFYDFDSYEDFKNCKIASVTDRKYDDVNYMSSRSVNLQIDDYIKLLYRINNSEKDDVTEIFDDIEKERLDFELGKVTIKPHLHRANKYLYNCLKNSKQKADESMNAFILGLNLCFGNDISDSLARYSRDEIEDELNIKDITTENEIFLNRRYVKELKDFKRQREDDRQIDNYAILYNFSQALAHFGINISKNKEGKEFFELRYDKENSTDEKQLYCETICTSEGLEELFEKVNSEVTKKNVNRIINREKE